PVEALVDALAADKVIEKDNFSLSIAKGKLTLNNKEVSNDIAVKYKSLIDALGDVSLNVNNTKK
ncbi:MAG: hypothetical protein KDC15_14580, partial [Chitinophagaceae bacterium]|nr:hypothetical protein [Chitinophagaceae bacterium]